jgi:hypothetical protein
MTTRSRFDFAANKWRAELVALLAALQPECKHCDDEQLDITISCDNDLSKDWRYQTGDNSFSGSCYGQPHWAVGTLGRGDTAAEREALADSLLNDLGDLWAAQPENAGPLALETVERTAPAAWAPYLINGDSSGLEYSDNGAAEIAAADAWLASLADTVEPGGPVGCMSAGFRSTHDAWQFWPYAGECETFQFFAKRDTGHGPAVESKAD